MRIFPRKNETKYIAVVVGMALFVLAATVYAAPVSAQGPLVTPTPLPQVQATRQAAQATANNVSNLEAERSAAQSRLNEINRNIEAQIRAAEQAAADARNAAATQNAVEAGAAIGRLEGALAQLRDSYAGKDAIIAGLSTKLGEQSAQLAEDKRTIDSLTTQLTQANKDKQTAVNAYNTATARQQESDNTALVNNAIWLIVALAFLLALIMLLVYLLTHRRNNDPAPPEQTNAWQVTRSDSDDETGG